MFGKKKKEDKGLPDLSSNQQFIPSIKDYERNHKDEEEKIYDLPSFPDSPMKKGFSQAAIKEAVITPENTELSELPKYSEQKVIEMEEWKPSQTSEYEDLLPPPELPAEKEQKLPSIPEEPHYSKEFHSEYRVPAPIPPQIYTIPTKQNLNKPIFVKVDKVQAAHDTINEIEEKLNEIENTLKKIRETKQKEEYELASWEKELESIKSRIKAINSNIFDNAM